MSTLLRALGLFTYYNNLGEIEPGSLLVADNVVIDRNGVIEPRRGFKQFGTTMPALPDRAKQLMIYKDRVFRHYLDTTTSDNLLQYDSDGNGTFVSFDGTYNETEPGLRIKYLEANSNFYFTTDMGVKKISARSPSDFTTASGYIVDAGVSKALDLTAVINYTTSGFFTPISKVAYRLVWAYEDLNGNLIRGAPSSRTVVTNFDENLSATVDLTFAIPDDITNVYFYQLYRTAVSTVATVADLDDLDPGDEQYLVLENSVTDADLLAGTITVNDITPEDFRSGGTLLETNPISGDGIAKGSNERPPIAKDLALYKGCTFYANTTTRHRKTFSLLSVDDFVSGTSTFIISSGATTNIYTFVGVKEISQVTTIAQAGITDTSFFLLNSSSNERKYFVWMDKTGTSLEPATAQTVGRVPIRVDISGATTDATVATAIFTALSANDDFEVSVLTNVVTISNSNNGKTDDTVDSTDIPTTFGFATTQQGDGEDSSLNHVLLSALPTVAQQVDETARSLVKIINLNPNEIVYASYLSGPDDVPGQILLEARSLEDVTYFLAVGDSTISGEFSPALPYEHTITAISNTNPTVVTSTAHGLTTGDTIVIHDTDSNPLIDGVRVVTVLSLNTFSVPVSVASAGTTGGFFLATEASDNEKFGNRVYYSKFQQPEAVPLVNYFDIGPKDKQIKRIIGLRDSLFVLKEDGVYRISGVFPTFQDTLFDGSTTIAASDSAVVLNNQIYSLCNDGVTVINESGVEVISRPIDDLIGEVLKFEFTSTPTASFGISYESDRSYLLWTPTESDDTFATQVFRYNTFTQTWTRWLRSETCGLLSTKTNKLYLGSATMNTIDQERKDFTRKDFADRELFRSIPSDGIEENHITLNSLIDVDVGDFISQLQYLTIVEFNTMLKKLDSDFQVTFTDYLSTLEAIPGCSLRNQVDALANKLDTDPGINDSDYFASLGGGSSFPDIQDDFNIIANKLNADLGVFQSNFKESLGTKSIDVIISEVNTEDGFVVIQHVMNFIEGDVTISKGIDCTVVWAPIHFGDASKLKQVNQGTYIFDNRNIFTTASVAYSTDLSTGFEEIPFAFPGAGVWGFFTWGDMTWGGEKNSAPLRTLVPKQKQRCRFINCKFHHTNAFEKFSILGLSLEAREFSERAYR